MLTRRPCKFFVRDMLEHVFLMICKGQVLDAALHEGLIQAAEPRHARRPQPRRGFRRPNRSRAPPRPHLRHGPRRAPRPLGPAQGSLALKVQYAKLRAPKGVVLAVVLQHSADHARAEDVSFATTPEPLRPRSAAHSTGCRGGAGGRPTAVWPSTDRARAEAGSFAVPPEQLQLSKGYQQSRACVESPLAGRPALGPPVSLRVAMLVLHRLLGCIYVVL